MISSLGEVLKSVLMHVRRLKKWLLVGKAPIILFYGFPSRTNDVDICFYLDPEEEELMNTLQSIASDWGLNWRDLRHNIDAFFRRGTGIPLRTPFIMEHNIYYSLHLLPIIRSSARYRIYKEAFINREIIEFEGFLVNTPTLEYWICLKLYSGRLKDLGDLELVLSRIRLKLNMPQIYDIFSRHPILRERWNKLLNALREDYGCIITKNGEIKKVEETWDPW